tara:strand:- start:1889 stop:1999 length:111 start_codon:yes stop_codon:yes gene_type:complete
MKVLVIFINIPVIFWELMGILEGKMWESLIKDKKIL